MVSLTAKLCVFLRLPLINSKKTENIFDTSEVCEFLSDDLRQLWSLQFQNWPVFG